VGYNQRLAQELRMPSLAVLLVATPVFGFTLAPPTASIEPVAALGAATNAAADLRLSSALALRVLGDDEEESVAGSGGDDGEEAENAKDQAGEDDDADQAAYLAEVKERNSLAKVHRPLGLATWAAMTVTVALGVIQYYNLYGFFDGRGDNPCVQGDAIFGQDQCAGAPWPHRIGWITTSALYTATFTVSLMMPDPDDLANAKGEFGDTLRMHKLLRWVHFSGMLAQLALGLIISQGAFGLDRANDYDTLQKLATVHLATGLVTYGALTWAGALMTF
jgi:hypothetical protein